MAYTAQQHKLMRHLGLRPWVRREVGQEAQAQILTANGAVGLAVGSVTGSSQAKPSLANAERHKMQLRQSLGQATSPNRSPAQQALAKATSPAQKPAVVGQSNRSTSPQPSSLQSTSVENQQEQDQQPSKTKIAPQSSPLRRESKINAATLGRAAEPVASADVGDNSQATNIPSPLSLMYAQVLPGVWLVAECDEWDRGGQVLFQRLLKACSDLVMRQGYQMTAAPEIEWFHWPLRLPAPIKNDEHNLRQALRGWVNGRRRPGALWISLGRRFVEMLLPSKLDKGLRHQGRSGMDVIWFEGLPAMQIEPEHKAILWQFLQQALPSAVAAAEKSP